MNDDTTDARPVDDRTPPSKLDPDALLALIKRWHKRDIDRVRQWREQEAEPAYRFVDGDQWDENDRQTMEDEGRVPITLNRVGPIIDVTTGLAINQRQDTTAKQRGLEDSAVAECATALLDWNRDDCLQDEQETDAFRDVLIGGMGWVETRIDDVGDVRVVGERIDPFEMVWDASAKARNLADGRHVMRVREMDIDAAREMFPGIEDDELHATWASAAGPDDGPERGRGAGYQGTGVAGKDLTGTVTVVQVVWREVEQAGEITHGDGRKEEIPADQLELAVQRLTQAGQPPAGVRAVKKWCTYQAFVGKRILEGVEKLPSEGELTYQPITGKYDRKKGYFYGVVRAAIDPQRHANKVVSKQLQLLLTTAQNAVLYEDGAFTDPDDAKNLWAKPSPFISVANGALGNGRIQVISPPTISPALTEQLTLALSSIRDCTGINLELMGMQDREQAAILESQRKQAAVTILAVFFDNLRRMRKVVGKIRLRLLTSGIVPKEDLAEAVGPEKAQALPALLGPHALRFDLVVDESPDSVNAQERAWTAIGPLMPYLMKLGPQVPPDAWAEILKLSPMPATIAEKIGQKLTAPPSPEQQMQKQLAQQGEQAKVAKDQTAAEKQHAEAEQTQIENMRLMHTPIEDPNLANQARIAAINSRPNGPPA